MTDSNTPKTSVIPASQLADNQHELSVNPSVLDDGINQQNGFLGHTIHSMPKEKIAASILADHFAIREIEKNRAISYEGKPAKKPLTVFWRGVNYDVDIIEALLKAAADNRTLIQNNTRNNENNEIFPEGTSKEAVEPLENMDRLLTRCPEKELASSADLAREFSALKEEATKLLSIEALDQHNKSKIKGLNKDNVNNLDIKAARINFKRELCKPHFQRIIEGLDAIKGTIKTVIGDPEINPEPVKSTPNIPRIISPSQLAEESTSLYKLALSFVDQATQRIAVAEHYITSDRDHTVANKASQQR